MSENVNHTIEEVLENAKKSNRRADLKLIRRAYDFAKSKHGEQLRRSGEPYIIHPVQVAYILSTLGLDESTICAALLHDVIEDTDVTLQDLSKEFSPEIAEMVDGVTKLGKLNYTSEQEQQVENYRKMFLAMGKDIRVILIKLADRLHNMRTLKYLARDRQIANARETMDLYAPLANRLGMYSLKWELEDLSFKYLYPEEYRELVEGIDKKREERLKFIDQIMDECGLQSFHKDRYPHEFSGGQRQRICIARALALNPEFVVCDEPVSALDVSIQAQIINLLRKLQQERNLTYLFISHDLSVVEHISDTVGVMYLGNLVEYGATEDIFKHPLHPYTEALFSAIPIPDPKAKMNRIVLEGTIPSPANPPTGCKFHTRCAHCTQRCKEEAPRQIEVEPGHYVVCHLFDK